MNWEAVAAISEATGVAGVIVSIIYLAHQVRQSGYATKAATVDQITGRFIDWMTTNTRTENVKKYFREGIPALVEATDDEVMEFYAAIQSLFKIIEEIQYHRSQGFIDDDIWIGWDNWFGNMKSYEVVAYFYKLKKDNMSPSFRDYWDNLAENPDNSLVSIVRSLNADSSK
jgi:hypothetical protein